MPRTIKSTRIKWLPPKVQLRIKDSLSGSIPVHSRTPSDNRTGRYSISFNDEKTVIFKNFVVIGIGGSMGLSMPVGLHTTNPALYRYDSTGSLVSNNELRSNLVITGNVKKGLGDSYITFTPGQEMNPFLDSQNPAVDGITNNDRFYATGSQITDIGDGFDQPLWSKSKFEVDITPSVSHSFAIYNYTSSSVNFPMAYWNKVNKKWEGIGAGKEFGLYVTGTQSSFERLCEDQCIGFGVGLNQGGSGVEDYGLGAKVSNYGFPYHAKFHATSSNLISLVDYISSPFLLEKIVVEWSGTLAFNNTAFGTATSYTACTFFILNQRQPFGVNDPGLQRFVYRTGDEHTHTMISGALLPSSYNGSGSVNTLRDLVTFSQIVGFGSSSDDTQVSRGSRELNLLYGDSRLTDDYGAWSGRMIMSGTVKSALANQGLETIQNGHNDTGISAMILVNQNGTRSGLFQSSGRDYVGTLAQGDEISRYDSLTSNFPGSTDPTGSIITLDRYSKPNPYLLHPTDKLVFGWQLPVANRINSAFGSPQYNGKGTELLFAAVPSKITFFGSMVSQGKEHHDTLNQLLSSVAIHEVIG
jgi:hypothetical protein